MEGEGRNEVVHSGETTRSGVRVGALLRKAGKHQKQRGKYQEAE